MNETSPQPIQDGLTERERKQALGLISAPPTGMGDITAATVLMLQMLGNPLASLEAEGLDMYTMAEACWLHCAPRAEVRRFIAHGDRGLVKLAVLEWADTLQPSQLAEMIAYLAAAADSAQASLALVSDSGMKQKNGMAAAERESGNTGSSGRSGHGGALPEFDAASPAGAGAARSAGEQGGDPALGEG